MSEARRALPPADEDTAAATAPARPARALPEKPRGRHTARNILLVILVLLLVLGGLGYGYMKSKLGALQRDPNLMPSRTATPEMVSGPITFLLLGSDQRMNGQDSDDPDLQDGQRSDTMMLVYIPADREYVYVISLTRDMWVPIHGGDWAKINAAYSEGGAPLSVLTVEDLLDVPIQHVAITDFAGFLKLMDILGGVDVYNEIESEELGIHFPQGMIHLEGDYGLAYVRDRKSLPNGDLDRTARQRTVVKAIIAKLLSQGTLRDPGKLNRAIDQLASVFKVDSGVTDGFILGLASGMKIQGGEDVRSLQVPIAGFQTSWDGQAANVVDWDQLFELSQALKRDRMDEYYREHMNDGPTTGNLDLSVPLPSGPATKVQLTPNPTTSPTARRTKRTPTPTVTKS